jgi:hypothetical protein
MRTLSRFIASALLLFAGAASASTVPSDAELWSLYLYEQAAQLCGVALTEEEETELDEAQHHLRLRLGLSRPQAAALYREARATVLSAKEAVCARELGPDLQADFQRPGGGRG